MKLGHKSIPNGSSIASKHVVHEVTQRTPKVLATREAMLVDEQDIVFEAGVEVRLQTELNDDRIVMAVDMRVDPIKSLEQLPDQGWERLRERHA